MKSFVIVCFALFALASALPLQWTSIFRRQSDLEAETDKLLFSVSMADFQAARAAQDPPEFDWSSNGCTASPDQPLGYNFQPSCNRHDFGYRNYKKQGRFTDDNKDRIDDNFKADLYTECGKRGAISGAICKGVANIYYEAVSTFGGKRSLEGQ